MLGWIPWLLWVGWPWLLLPPHAAGPVGAVWLCIAIPAGVAVAARHARRQRLRYQVPPAAERVRQPIPPAVRAAVWVKCGGRCMRCRLSDEDCMAMTGQHLQYDHIIPWSRGGPDTEDNLQLLCPPCNRAKGASLMH
jgi:5-methylcytosine-specific restriction endonuclease McrA